MPRLQVFFSCYDFPNDFAMAFYGFPAPENGRKIRVCRMCRNFFIKKIPKNPEVNP